MTDNTIRIVPEDEQYQFMLSMWEEQRRPGWIDYGGVLWQVAQRSPDNATIFIRKGANEDFYSERSTKGIIK